MYRLIYVTADSNYYTSDSETSSELVASEEILREQGFVVLCVIDYESRSISNKSSDYPEHRDRIDDLIFDPMFVANW
jgi:hypothetical protein